MIEKTFAPTLTGKLLFWKDRLGVLAIIAIIALFAYVYLEVDAVIVIALGLLVWGVSSFFAYKKYNITFKVAENELCFLRGNTLVFQENIRALDFKLRTTKHSYLFDYILHGKSEIVDCTMLGSQQFGELGKTLTNIIATGEMLRLIHSTGNWAAYTASDDVHLFVDIGVQDLDAQGRFIYCHLLQICISIEGTTSEDFKNFNKALSEIVTLLSKDSNHWSIVFRESHDTYIKMGLYARDPVDEALIEKINAINYVHVSTHLQINDHLKAYDHLMSKTFAEEKENELIH